MLAEHAQVLSGAPPTATAGAAAAAGAAGVPAEAAKAATVDGLAGGSGDADAGHIGWCSEQPPTVKAPLTHCAATGALFSRITPAAWAAGSAPMPPRKRLSCDTAVRHGHGRCRGLVGSVLRVGIGGLPAHPDNNDGGAASGGAATVQAPDGGIQQPPSGATRESLARMPTGAPNVAASGSDTDMAGAGPCSGDLGAGVAAETSREPAGSGEVDALPPWAPCSTLGPLQGRMPWLASRASLAAIASNMEVEPM